MKIRKVALLGLLISVSFVSGAFAASNLEKVEAYLRKDFQVFVGGVKADVGPVLVYNNSSYLPVATLGRLLNADVNWNSANLGIYINPRFAGQPDPVDDPDPDYALITMIRPQGYKATYLGKESPVLAVTTTDYETTYYRDVDIRRLGIDTRGLKLVKETRTGELYVSNKELVKATTQPPTFNYVYDKLIIGESDPDKLAVINNFIKDLPAMYKALGIKDPNFPTVDYITVPNVFMIEALPNDEYNMLGIENRNFKQYWLKLKQNVHGDWYQAQYKIYDLGPVAPQY